MEDKETYDVKPLPPPREGQPIQGGDYPVVVGWDGKGAKVGKIKTIIFEAEVKKVQTTVDGGIRLTLDLPEQAREVMSELAKCQQNGIVLAIEAIKTK